MSISNELASALNQKDRVREQFSHSVNSRIDRKVEARIQYLIAQGPEAISRQVGELDREWDIDRALMATFPVLGGAVLSAGLFKNRKWFPLLGVQMSFLLYHAIKGWCPPASVMRRMGFRTQKEIQAERYILLSALQSRLGSGARTKGVA